MPKDKQNSEFLVLPVRLIPKLNPYTALGIFNHCVTEYALTIKVTQEQIMQDLVYPWYHDFDRLPARIFKRLEELSEGIVEMHDEDYKGFGGGEFDSSYAATELMDSGLITREDWVDFKYFAQIWGAIDLLGLRPWADHMGRTPQDISRSRRKEYIRKPGEPFAMIKAGVFDAAVDRRLPMDAFKLYAAIRSVEGNKQFVVTDKVMLHSRILGHRKKVDKGALPKYKMDRNLRELVDHNLISFNPMARHLAISTKVGIKNLKELTIKGLRNRNPPKPKFGGLDTQ